MILQDATVYLSLGNTQGIKSPLLEIRKSVFKMKAFESFQKEVVQVIVMKKIPLPEDLPPNMMLTLKVLNANQAIDMLAVEDYLAQVNEKMAQQSN